MSSLPSRFGIRTALIAGVAVGVGLLGLRTLGDSGGSLDDLEGFGQTGALEEVKHFSSLQGIVDGADLVVTGRVVAASEGRKFGRPGLDEVSYVNITVRVDQVIKGTAKHDDELLVEFFAGRDDGAGLMKGLSSVREGTWFLTNKADEAIRLGLSGELVTRELGFHMLASSQGLVVDDRGEARSVLNNEVGTPLHNESNSRRYADFVSDARNAVRR